MPEIKAKNTMGQALDLDGKDRPISDANRNYIDIILKLRKHIKQLKTKITALGG